MKSITIHNMEDELESCIRKKARENGESLNKTIKRVLIRALGLHKETKSHRSDFEELFGIWSNNEKDDFDQSIEDLGIIDRRDWT